MDAVAQDYELSLFRRNRRRISGRGAVSHIISSVADVANRLVRIIDDFASHGKIDAPARAKGMIEGETLIFSPSDDLAHVDITIENCTVNVDQLKI